MGRGIIKIQDKYFEWSTIVDAPLTYGMSLVELQEYVRDEYGQQGLNELPARLERVEKTGTSYHDHTLKGLISCNRAGDNEKHLTEKQIYAKYAESHD